MSERVGSGVYRESGMAMCKPIFIVFFSVLIWFAVWGCGDEATEPGDPILTVLEIEVSADDGISAGEIEIHVFEDSTDVFLGCVRMTGISRDVSYQPNARFQKPDGSDLLFDEVADKTIWLQIFEDDSDACPALFDPSSDDMLVITPPIVAADLAFGASFQFSKVPWLVLGI